MANRIFGDELQQRWIAKVVSTFENDPLTHQVRVMFQVSAQTCCITCIEKIDGATKQGVFYSLMMGQVHWMRVHEDISPTGLAPADFSARVRTAAHRMASKSAEARNKTASIGRRCVATGIATPAPVHSVRYAAMHIGHFGTRTSSAPEPTHPLVPCHHLC
jgi:hypothetical protein